MRASISNPKGAASGYNGYRMFRGGQTLDKTANTHGFRVTLTIQ